MHPIIFGEETILNNSQDYQIVVNDKPFFALRGDANAYTIYLPDSAKTPDGFTVAIHNQTNSDNLKSISVASGSSDTIVGENPTIPMAQPGQIYILKLEKPLKQWRKLLGYYPGNSN
jgi:hypothetical protein